MPDNDYALLASMLTDLQQAVSELHIKVAQLEMKCSWTAGALGLLGGGIPAVVLLIMHFVK